MFSKKTIKILFIFLIASSFYFIIYFNEDKNFFLGIKNILPIKLKENIKIFLFPYKLKEEKDIWKSHSFKTNEIIKISEFTFNLSDINSLKNKREILLTKYILNKEQITFSEVYKNDKTFKKFNQEEKNLNDARVYKVKYYNIDHYGFFHEGDKKCNEKKLIIYVNGHSDSAYQHDDFLLFKNTIKDKCYDLFVLGMSGLGFNSISNNSFPGQLKEIDKSSHEVFKTFKDINFKIKKPLSLMLSGNYFLIKNFLNSTSKYQKIYMVGLSGGGWYTTFLSSIITDINSSFSIAGTSPLIFQANVLDNYGDWEQNSSEVYKELNYVDLYLLSTYDENFNKTRKHYQIYNSGDPCCFKIDTSTKMKKIFEKLNIKNFDIIIWKNDKHSILPQQLIKLLK